jgi:hypothetical protein
VNTIYRVVDQLPESAVLIEFPFGESAHKISRCSMPAAIAGDWSNGYSGFFPRRDTDRVGALHDISVNPERTAAVLRSSGATHALVH